VAHLNDMAKLLHVVEIVFHFRLDCYVLIGTRPSRKSRLRPLRVSRFVCDWIIVTRGIFCLPGTISETGTHHSLVVRVGLWVETSTRVAYG